MSLAKQICLGVAVAGMIGVGSAATAAVANADSSGATQSASADRSSSTSTAQRPGRRSQSALATQRNAGTASRLSAPAASASTAPRVPRRGIVATSSAVIPAPTPLPVPQSPIPVFPISPASATASSTSTAIGRSRIAPSAATQPLQFQLAAPAQHVLVIGLDGTNLSAILADDYNQNLFDLMNDGTTAASTIIGHTTISNPSWTGILTGVWGETAGVSNNVFTPSTYDTWPTIFNQLETYNPAIKTTAIADWAVIAQIAGAGSAPAENILYYPKINDSWLDTDDEVGVASVNSIQNTLAGTPSFQFSYFVGVDETGHDFSAGSPEYANALRNADENVGAIMDAVRAWELANPGEEWTVIVTTDHGQDPSRQIGLLAHGFQTPYETTTFVIANGPGFRQGAVNNTYVNIDVTPTVAQLFGISPEPYSQGKPLMDRSANNYQPVIPGQDALHQALTDAINMYGYPDIVTNLVLAWRTIAMTIPYVIYTAFNDLSSGLPEILDFAVKFIGAIAYNIANIPAQIVARITGVTGNSILPVDWWPYNPVPGTQTEPPTANPAAAAAIAA